MRKNLSHEIRAHAERKPLGQPQQQIYRLQGKVNPPALQTYASVPHAQPQVLSQERFQIAQDRRVHCWVQPVTSVVAIHAVELKAARNSAHSVGLLENRCLCDTHSLELERCSHCCRSRSQDHHLLPLGLTSIFGSTRATHGVQRVRARIRISRNGFVGCHLPNSFFSAPSFSLLAVAPAKSSDSSWPFGTCPLLTVGNSEPRPSTMASNPPSNPPLIMIV